MTVKLFSCKEDHRNLVKNLTQVGNTLTCTLLDDNTLLNPHILIKKIDDYKNINYMYIEEFGRYYYVTSVDIVTGNMLNISGNVDVLMSYAPKIKKIGALVVRSSTNGNLDIPDGDFRVSPQYQLQSSKQFPNKIPETQNFVITLL